VYTRSSFRSRFPLASTFPPTAAAPSPSFHAQSKRRRDPTEISTNGQRMISAYLLIISLTVVAAMFWQFVGYRRLARRMVMACIVGLSLEAAIPFAHTVSAKLAAGRAAAAKAARFRPIPAPSSPGYAVELSALEDESKLFPVCPQAKNERTIYLKPDHDEVNIHAEASCWSQQVCVTPGASMVHVYPRGEFDNCTWYDQGFYSNHPYCFGPGGQPYLRNVSASCLRLLGPGMIEVTADFPIYPR
jgi:hypothetical protein